MTTQTTDHADQAVARLPQQHKDKANIVALVRALCDPCQTLESAIWELLTERSIDTAIGAQLDVLGKIVGEVRNGLDDDTYRRHVKARVIANKSNGRTDDLGQVADQVLSDLLAAVTVEDEPPAAVLVRVTGVVLTEAVANTLIDFLLDTKSGGVRVLLSYAASLDADLYRYDTATPGLGLGAGKFAGVIEASGTGPVLAQATLAPDLQTPPAQESPVDASAFATAYPAVTTPDHLWPFDSAATPLTDDIGSDDLIVAGSNSLYQRKAIGLFDWVGFANHESWELRNDNDSTTYAETVGTTILDLDGSGVIGFFIRWRSRGNWSASTGNAFPLVGKNNGSVGWVLTVHPTEIKLSVDRASLDELSVSGNFNDGAWHSALCIFDEDGDTFDIFTDLGSDTGTLSAGAGTNVGKLKLGGADGLVASRNGSQVQYEHLCAWEDATGLGQTEFDLMATHAVAPSWLTTAAHAGTLQEFCERDTTDGLRLASFGADQYPIGYRDYTNTHNGRGLANRAAKTSLLGVTNNRHHDHDLTDWTASNVTKSSAAADLVDSPRGFREAWKLTSTSASGYVKYDYTTIAATEYTQAIMIRSGSGIVNGWLQIYDETGSVLLAEVGFNASTSWELVKLKATTNAGQISTSIRVKFAASAEVLHVFAATPVAGAEWALIPGIRAGTQNTTGDIEATDYRVTSAAGAILKSELGSIRCSASFDTGGNLAADFEGDGYLIAGSQDGATNDNLLELAYTAGAGPDFDLRDSAGVATIAIQDASDETYNGNQRTEAQWHSAAGLTANESAIILADGSEDETDNVTWTATNLLDRLWIGQDKSNANKLHALLTLLEIRDGAYPALVEQAFTAFPPAPPIVIAAFDLHSAELQRSGAEVVSCADAAPIDLTTDFTIEVYAYPDTLPTGGAVYGFAAKQGSGANDGFSFYIKHDTGSNYDVWAAVGDGTNSDVVAWSFNSIATATWFHFALTFDVSQTTANQFTFYADAVDQGAPTVIVNNDIASIGTNSDPLVFGAGYSTGSTFDGDLCEMRLWDHVRTSTQINDNKDQSVAADSAGLVAYIPNDGSGTVADVSDSALTVTATGVALGTNVPF